MKTVLARTKLILSQKILLASLAFCGQVINGNVSRLSRDFEISRPTVYTAAKTVGELIEDHFEEAEKNQQGIKILLDEAQLRRAVLVQYIVNKASFRDIKDAIFLLYPGLSISHPKICQILATAYDNAKIFNESVELSGIENSALDEMFSQTMPVLAGIDLDSGYNFILDVRKTRTGDDWVEVLEDGKKQGLDLKIVVKDAGVALKAGVDKTFVNAEQREDTFHVAWEIGKCKFWISRKAYSTITAEEDAEKALKKVQGKAKKDEKKEKELKKALEQARKRCQKWVDFNDKFEQAASLALDALECVDLESYQIRTPETMQAMFLQAAQILEQIPIEKSRKLSRYMANRSKRLFTYMNDFKEKLKELESEHGVDEVMLCCLIVQLLRELERNRRPWHEQEHKKHLLTVWTYLKYLAGDRADQVLEAVTTAFEHRYRASSAIEGFNASLRPYLYIHKSVGSGFLSLFQAYSNLRKRRTGRHKGSSAYEILTGNVVDDWLSLIGFPSSSASN